MKSKYCLLLTVLLVLSLILSGVAYAAEEGEEDLEAYLNQLDISEADRVALARSLEQYEGELSADILTDMVDSYAEGETSMGDLLTGVKGLDDLQEEGVSTSEIESLVNNAIPSDNTGKIIAEAALQLTEMARNGAGGEIISQTARELGELAREHEEPEEFRERARERVKEQTEKVEMEKEQSGKPDAVPGKGPENQDNENSSDDTGDDSEEMEEDKEEEQENEKDTGNKIETGKGKAEEKAQKP